MDNSLKESNFEVITEPTYVRTDCPYCGKGFKMDYDDFTDSTSYYPGDWIGEKVECPHCYKNIVIGIVNWE